MGADSFLRIGELGRRTGVSPQLLRAWERRYGLMQPRRSAGGLRLYSLDDVERVRRMREHLAAGLAAAEAARLAVRPHAAPGPAQTALDPGAVRRELRQAIDGLDEPRAQVVLDELLTAATVDTALTAVVLPYLHELGERWQRGEASIAQEHFASSLLRGRLLALARGWGRGLGPLALLACLPGERHDLGLIAFGLLLRARGWRIAYLGADTPIATLDAAARSLRPDLVVASAVTPERVTPHAEPLHEVAQRHRVVIGGAGASEEAARRSGTTALPSDPAAAADQVTAALAESAPGRRRRGATRP